MGKKYAYVARAIDNPYVPPVPPPDPGNPPPPGGAIPGAEGAVYFARCYHTSPYTITVRFDGDDDHQVIVGSSASDRQISSPGGVQHVFNVAAGWQGLWVYVNGSPTIGAWRIQVDNSRVESVVNLGLFPLLTSTIFQNNPGLVSFDASDSASLTSVPNLSGSKAALDDYDLSGCTSLTVANVSDVTGAIDLSDCTSLANSNITDGGGSVSFNGCSALEGLEISDQAETSFDFTGCVALIATTIRRSNIAVIDMSAIVNLDRFTTVSLVTTSLILPPSLTYINIISTSIPDIDLTSMVSLSTLQISDNYSTTLTSLNLTNCSSLTSIRVIGSVLLNSINFTGCTAVTVLHIDRGVFTSLNLSAMNTSLESLTLYNLPSLPSLGLGSLTAMISLNLAQLVATSMSVDGCTSLLEVDLVNMTGFTNTDRDGILIDLVDNGLSNGEVDVDGALDSAGQTAKTTLEGRGWTVQT